MPRSILASLTGLGLDHAVMETAIAAARRDNGHITALHAAIDVVETAATIEFLAPWPRDFNIIHQVSREESERKNSAEAAYQAAIKRHAVSPGEEPSASAVTAAWRETKSFFGETLEEARYHDITVMARDRALSPDRLKSVLMQSGRPLLLAPDKPLETVGRRVAIAWKTGAEAARAVTAAAPWLARADTVVLLCAAAKNNEAELHAARRVAQSLKWNGIKADVESRQAAGSEAQLLQQMAYDHNADLLVMGAYGHSRMREYILGGVSEGMLAGCAIPVFMFR